MAQDYKNNSSRRKTGGKSRPGDSPANRGSSLLGFFSGLGLGLFVAFLIYITGLSAQSVNVKCESVAEQTPKEIDNSLPKPHPDAEKPRFEFYTILPEREVIIPEHELETVSDDGDNSSAAHPKKVVNSREYVLQAGSFRSFRDADRLKAKLALLGVIATIQPVTIKEGERWHRVRIGPFDTLADLNRTRELLGRHEIKVILLKQK